MANLVRLLRHPKNISKDFLRICRTFHDEFQSQEQTKKFVNSKDPLLDQGTEIFDVEQEKQRKDYNESGYTPSLRDKYNTDRGTSGVFEIEELVHVLRNENAQNIFVCTVPKDIKYVDYLCIVSGKNYRHMIALSELVRRLFKLKRDKGDLLPKIEGENSKDWIAMDLGNIALHIFSQNARLTYDLESLWCLGPEFDPESNKEDDAFVQLFQKHSNLLHRSINGS